MSENQTAIAKAAPQTPTHIARLQAFLKPRMSTLAQYAGRLVDPDTLVKLACYEASRPESSWMERCTPESIYAALIISAQLGLEPGHVKGEAYFVPYGSKCQLIPGYRGFVKLAMQSGLVRSIRARSVFAGDEFVVMHGTEEYIRHVPSFDQEGDHEPQVIAAYAVADFKDGGPKFDVLPRWALDKRRKASQQANGAAWKQWPEEMYAKTVIRHASKQWPLGDRFARAAKLEEAQETGKHEDLRGVIDLPPDAVSEEPAQVQVIEKPSRLQEAAERANGSSSKPAPTWSWTDPDPDGKSTGKCSDGRGASVEQTGVNTFGWWAFDANGVQIADGEARSIVSARTAAERAQAK